MSKTEENLLKIPIVKWIIKFLNSIKIPGMEGMNLYDLFEMYITGIIKGALTARAGSIAFSFFLALFPFTLFVLTLIPYIPIEGFQENFIAFILQSMPSQEASAAIDNVIHDIAKNKYGELLSFGLLLSMFLMTNGVNAIFSGFEYTYHQIETRTVIRQYLISLIVSLMLVFLLLFTVSVIVFLGLIINNLKEKGIVSNTVIWVRFAQYLIMIIMLYTTVSILFYFGTKEGKKTPFFSTGTIFTTVFFIINFLIFGIYLQKFGQYNKLYGSIGTVMIIMLFIWLNSIILLLGFELNTTLSVMHEKNIALQRLKKIRNE
ncbi:MAG: YihY/virulence factor BrkB family protein [Flavobacteriaceae bacterium]|nr:YihY/virulence factor BrkB family protein [Flavobacteriaceae bacterium]